MKKIFGFVVVMFFMSWSQAFADYSYSFSFISNDKSLLASGTLYTASNGAGPLTVTGGFIDGSFGYATLYYAPVSSGYLTSPGGAFWYDNQLSPGSPQWLTLYGLLFTVGAKDDPGYKEINLWGNSAAKNDYSLVQWTSATGYSDYTSFSSKGTATVPIPGAILLFAPGLAGIALLRRRNKQ
jgi:hypothetical protein